jgi:hypothetical protein
MPRVPKRKRPTTREGRRRLTELRSILRIRHIRKASKVATQRELDALAPILQPTSDEVAA